MTDNYPFPLTSLRLRFRCRAETRLHLAGFKAGSFLRGGLVQVMQRATCAHLTPGPSPNRRGESLPGGRKAPTKEHAMSCPVCWLVAADDHPGQERRGYVLTPPISTQTDLKSHAHPPSTGTNNEVTPAGRATSQEKTFWVSDSLQPGETFEFHITLFGEAARYLPYFVLAVPEVGRNGVGPGRGRFSLQTIHAEHPLEGDWPVLEEGENLVRPPSQPVTHTAVAQAAEALAASLDGRHPRLQIEFLAPMRLILDGHLLKSPDFGVLFARLLERLDELSIQHAGGSPRTPEDRQRLWRLADQVRLVEDQTHWIEVPSGSSRSGKTTWISGMVGPAWYSAPTEVWQEILPWLLWGEIAQVGKDTAKGNGVFRVQSL